MSTKNKKYLKIFDSCTHPTISKKFHNIKNNSFDDISKAMKKNKIYKACAIGMDNFEDYDHYRYIEECSNFNCFVPIAGYKPINSRSKTIKNLKLIKKLGYKAIKIHPRISKINLNENYFKLTVEVCNDLRLPIMLCTYWHTSYLNQSHIGMIETLIKSLGNSKIYKIILMHGGNVKILEFAEFVRNNVDNFLLDLSLTLMKYKGSSIDSDLSFLFKNFDERICIGSDSPEWDLRDFKNRFKYFSNDINQIKINNIGFKNLENFLDL